MEITNNIGNNHTSFGIRIVTNEAFRKTVKYAAKNGKLQELDDALYKLSKAGDGDLLIINGVDKSGKVFSNFTLDAKRSVSNQCHNSAEEAAVNGFIELSEFGEKFRKLFGKKVKFKRVYPSVIIAKYGSKN